MNKDRQILRIKSVAVGDGFDLTVTWENGSAVLVDLSDWIATGAKYTAPLKDRAVFTCAQVFEYGSAIAWNDHGEVAIDSLHLMLLAEKQRRS